MEEDKITIIKNLGPSVVKTKIPDICLKKEKMSLI